MIYKGTFKHLTEVEYSFEVEADSEEEAIDKIYDDAFEYAGEEHDAAGLRITGVELE